MSYFDDVFDRVMRRARRIIRDVMRDVDEMEAWMEGLMEDLERSMNVRDLMDERVDELSRGSLRPLVSFEDLGEELLITVDLPGSDLGSAVIDLGPTSLRVSARIKEEYVGKAFGSASWARKIASYSGEFRLPEPVDPSTARVRKANGMVVIRVRKARPGR